MWIRIQNKQRIINSNHIIDIFVARTAPVIYANTTDDADYIVLGEYKDKDTCLDILEHLLVVIGSSIPAITMPFGGEVEGWKKDVASLATIYISNDFRH
jgi:hypothetical protein